MAKFLKVVDSVFKGTARSADNVITGATKVGKAGYGAAKASTDVLDGVTNMVSGAGKTVSKAWNKSKDIPGVGRGVEAVGRGAGKAKLSPLVDNKTGDKNFMNGFTGKKVNPLYSGAIGLGFVGYKAGETALGYSPSEIRSGEVFTKPGIFDDMKMKAANNMEHAGAPEMMNYDGVGTAPKNLNAEGNLVFGLHNKRKG